MDNIAKLVLGVVALIGLLVLMIPQGDPLNSDAPTTAVVAAAAADAAAGPPDPIPNEAPQNEPDAAGANTAPTQAIPAFGQPMLDPTPAGDRQIQQQQQQQAQQPLAGNEGNYTGEESVAPFPANPAGGAPPAIPPIQ